MTALASMVPTKPCCQREATTLEYRQEEIRQEPLSARDRAHRTETQRLVWSTPPRSDLFVLIQVDIRRPVSSNDLRH